MRTGHPAARKAAASAARSTAPRHGPGRARAPRSRTPRTPRTVATCPELVAGRNPVVEALRAKVPAQAMYVALGIDADDAD